MTKRRSKKSAESDSSSPEKKVKCDSNNVEEWGIDKVSDFLLKKDLDFAVQPFIENHINGSVLKYLREDQLKEIGISALGDRLQLMAAIEALLPATVSNLPQIQNQNDESKVFNDPIHGHIEMHPLCVKIIDTPQFQRLRYLRQLGGCYFVFPGASHNRFEHSIGVSHLARELTQTLQRRQPELNITNKDVLCVQIAGLCHDLGHGPFSHLFDGRFIPAVRTDKKWQHEGASVQMFQYLVDDNDLVPYFEQWNLDSQDRDFIKEQIAGPCNKEDREWPYHGRSKNKAFLYEIVANKRNGIDVDKWDYFARDCHHLGLSNNFDHKRFMQFARVLDVDGEKQICSRDKELGNVYRMFQMRCELHRCAYQHKNKAIVEIMITEALIKANDHILIAGKNGQQMKMSETIDDMVAYCKLTDYIFHQILYSTEPELEESRRILQKIEKRQLYKCIGQSRTKDKKTRFTREDLPNITKSIVDESHDFYNNTDKIAEVINVQLVSFDYGMKSENPIDHVRFYMKSNPTQGVHIRRDDASALLPNIFHEQYIRVFCKSNKPDHIDALTKTFNRWCASKQFVNPGAKDLLSIELTPLKCYPQTKSQ